MSGEVVDTVECVDGLDVIVGLKNRDGFAKIDKIGDYMIEFCGEEEDNDGKM
jgi:hypothetical protein